MYLIHVYLYMYKYTRRAVAIKAATNLVSFGSNGVQLINEDNGRGILLSLLESCHEKNKIMIRRNPTQIN